MTGVFIKKRKFGHKHIQRKDDVKTQGEDSQGERSGTDPSLTGLRRNKNLQQLHRRFLATITVRHCLFCLNHPVFSTLL